MKKTNRFIIIIILLLVCKLTTYAQRDGDKSIFLVTNVSYYAFDNNAVPALDFSIHYLGDYVGVDLYSVKSFYDVFRKHYYTDGEIQLIDKVFSRYEINGVYNFYAHYGRAFKLLKVKFYDATIYYQLRFGITNQKYARKCNLLDSLPILEGNFYKYQYTDGIQLSNDNFLHFGLSRSKRYDDYGNSFSGIMKLYFDVVYAPTLSLDFLTEDGNNNYLGYYPIMSNKNLGFRCGFEHTSTFYFGTYFSLEWGIMPAPTQYLGKSNYLVYMSYKVGFSGGYNSL